MSMRFIAASLMVIVGMSSCAKSRIDGSMVRALSTNVKQALPDLTNNPDAICAYIKNNGYFPSNSYAAGTVVAFSSSYDIVQDARAQAWGVVTPDGRFEQKGNPSGNLMLCPGVERPRYATGKCLWQIAGDRGYAQLSYDVVCNKRSKRVKSGVHTGYDTEEAAIVDYKGDTSGRSVSGQDAVRVTLKSRETTTTILFAKGVGLVATHFQETSSPDGTAEVFIGGTAE